MKYFAKGDASVDFHTAAYFDREKGFFRALGYRWGSLTEIFASKVREAYDRATKRGIVGNTLTGEGRLLGGLLVVAGGKILYEYREEGFGDLLTVERVVEAIYQAEGKHFESVPPNQQTVVSGHEEVCNEDECGISG